MRRTSSRRSWLVSVCAIVCLAAIADAQVGWTVAVTPTMDPLPAGFCAAIRVTVFDAATGDVPRNPLGYRLTISDFDISVSGSSVIANRLGATNWESCACQGAAPGSTATVTATYPAKSLAANARVPGVSFQRSATFTIAPPKGTSNPPACRAAGYPANGPALPTATALPPSAPPVAIAQPPAAAAPATPASVATPPVAPVPATQSPAAPTMPVPLPDSPPATRPANAAPRLPVAVALPPSAPPVGLVPPPVAAPVPINPSGFAAAQTGQGQVQLSWLPVSGVSFYLLLGPGVTPGGEKVVGMTTFTARNVPAGSQQWAVASFYEPGNISTAADAFPRVSLNVVALAPPAAPAPAPSAATPPPSVVSTARYRLVAKGFRVVNPTVDNLPNLDGAGDEVYGGFAMFHVNRANGQVLDQDLRRTNVHGQIIPSFNRFVAGSATPSGGLRSGDSYPGAAPAAAPGTQTFPFIIWEGTLTNAQDALVVLPTMWEWDNDDSSYDDWFLSERAALPVFWWDEGIQLALQARAPWWVITETFATNFGFAGLLPYTSKDRPVGMVLRPSGFELVRRALVLTREAIESGFNPAAATPNAAETSLDAMNAARDQLIRSVAAASVNADASSSSQATELIQSGRATQSGDVTIRLTDGPGPMLNGNYELYLKIERIP